MGILDIGDLSGIEDFELIKEDDYKVIIQSAELQEEKYCLAVQLNVDGEASAVFHNIWLPKPDDPPQKVTNKKRMIKQFLEAFEMPPTQESLMSYAEWAGLEAFCHINVEPERENPNGGTYPPRNNVRKWYKPQA